MSGDGATSEPANNKSNGVIDPIHTAEKREATPQAPTTAAKQELDEFGLPIRPRRKPSATHDEEGEEFEEAVEVQKDEDIKSVSEPKKESSTPAQKTEGGETSKESLQKEEQLSSRGRRSRHNSSAALAEVPSQTSTPNRSGRDRSTSKSANRKSLAKDSTSKHAHTASEWSHQQLAPQAEKESEPVEEDEWQEMPAYAPFDMYNDDGKLVAREAEDSGDEVVEYGTLGGAGKGYTRVQMDEDAQSATSMDENTAYLFKEKGTGTNIAEEDEDLRDAMGQMQATKELLTEGQRIAYVGIVRLAIIEMVKELESMEKTRGVKKIVELATESIQMWSQKMMVRIYGHMEIESAEQIMIEQLAEHGVQPGDLTPPLMQNARVKNPMKEDVSSGRQSVSSPRQSVSSPRIDSITKPSESTTSLGSGRSSDEPPPYDEHQQHELGEVKTPSQLPNTQKIDIDIRWTVLCDLFLILIADSTYDARSRRLLERVGSYLDVAWIDICRFEKRVTDALEMQEAASKENWNEDEHMATRKKMARNKRLVFMGLATVGGGLVIGLSAGLLAPVIGAGLAAGFTTIGVAGTSGFLAGAGGAAIVTTTGVVTGGTIAVRAANRRTGAVQTFEYRPLHNNKRVNLIVTVSGWMTGKVDDVRLPFSTVDPVMGDIYSVFWEPEMLQSMGQTISILATEALTQTLQQVLGSTILVALMAALQLPIVLTKLAYLIDNPWTVSMARADLAGLILADSLIDRNLGARPITLVGFSLGSRVIYACLRELAKKGQTSLIQNVYLFGAPIVANKDEFLRCKTAVAGRFVNGYATTDWILGYLFRATGGGIAKVAGLGPLNDIPGIENFNCTEWVPGHMSYRAAMPRLLREVGWMVESDEFTEIEDPDPDDHEKRQRELINEIEEARKQLQEKPEKKRFGFFKRNKKISERKDWEMYDERAKAAGTVESKEGDLENKAGGVLFDVDAIMAEVAELSAQGVEIKQLESTLPPMKLNLEPTPPLRATKSFNDSIASTPQKLGSPITAPSTADKALFDRKATNNHTYDEYDEYELNGAARGEEDISMTFESPSKPRIESGMSGIHHTSTAPPQLPSPEHDTSWDSSSAAALKPPLRSHITTPVVISLDHNAWADEDDGFGKETEMKMTFE